MHFSTLNPSLQIESVRRALTVGLGVQLLAAPALSAEDTVPPSKEITQATPIREIIGTRLTGAEAEESFSTQEFWYAESAMAHGFTTLGETLKYKLPSYGGTGILNEGFAIGGNGASTVSLRGLPGNATLTMVNGKRTSTSDLNLIPEAAIESIDILYDGASAVYGSDAVAGVVNVRLRKSYNGFKTTAYFGNTFDKDISARKFSALWGTSDEKTSVLFSAEYSKANSLLSIDRERSRPLPNAVSGTSNPGNFYNEESLPDGTLPLRWSLVPGKTLGLTNALQIPSGFNPFATVDLSSFPAGERNDERARAEEAANAGLPANSPVRYGSSPSLLPGINSGFPYGLYGIAIRPHERFGFNTSISRKLFGENLETYADAYYMANKSFNQLAPAPLTEQSMAANAYWIQQLFPGATNRLSASYRPVENGPRQSFVDWETIHTVAGLKGNIAESTWKWDVSFLYDRVTADQTDSNGVLSENYLETLNRTDSTAFNPFGYTPIGGASSVNPQSIVDSFRGEQTEKDTYTTQQIEGAIHGEIFDLPAGAVQLAFGAEHRRENWDIRPDKAGRNSEILGYPSSVAYTALRDTDAGYAEVSVPIFGKDLSFAGLRSFSINAAGRYESFSDAGNTGIKPRVGFRWEPIEKQLTIRGSWAQGFVAPGLAALNRPAGGQDYPEVENPLTKTRTQPKNGVLLTNNRNLQPEEADTYLVGFRYSPNFVNGFTVGADYYRIEQTKVPFESVQYIINRWYEFYQQDPNDLNQPKNPFGPNATHSAQNPLGAQVALAPDLEFDQIRNIGPINTGERFTDGFDLMANQEFKTGWGTFNLSARAARILNFTQENFPGSGSTDYLGKFWASGAVLEEVSFPEWRANAELAWKYERYSSSIGWNYTSSYTEDASGGNFSSPEYLDPRETGDYHTIDLRLGYRVPKIEADVEFGINNLFDEAPKQLFSTFGDGYDRIIGDLRGRYWYVSVAKEF